MLGGLVVELLDLVDEADGLFGRFDAVAQVVGAGILVLDIVAEHVPE